ncbi:tetratricopeptide repeat protein [Patescibacteria group bacterium]|nr:tetratricopeptide repeat protein [Patescibacteria group bacterium]MBU1123372.1 tetratricopeptide repeat protein [Patescibacteria group bacterium]MBU1911664.1 tetratricopeptide repeat protein [Patescibacteria group bacterium]
MINDPKPSASVLERLEKAEQLKLMGQHSEALDILVELLAEDPQNISALEEIADNELSMDHHGRAKKAAKQAIALDENSYTGHYILGFLHSQKEEWPQSLKYLQKANAIKSNNPEILRCLGWALFNGGQRTQGIVTLERALNLDSENPLTLCDLGVTHLQIKNFTKAKSLFLRALDLDPKNIRAKECVEAVERLEKVMTTKK